MKIRTQLLMLGLMLTAGFLYAGQLFTPAPDRSSCPQPVRIQQLSGRQEIQKLSKGRVLKLGADFCYNAQGRMVIQNDPPLSHVLLTDAEGHIQVYDPNTHTVRQVQDAYMGSSSSYIYTFLNHRMYDLGLKKLGFTLGESREVDGHEVSDWLPPETLEQRIGKIQLVHRDGQIVYAGYYTPKQSLFKKTFYAEYTQLGEVSLPTVMTEITYFDAEHQDSILERTTFSDFRLNEAALDSVCNFEIPADAQRP